MYYYNHDLDDPTQVEYMMMIISIVEYKYRPRPTFGRYRYHKRRRITAQVLIENDRAKNELLFENGVTYQTTLVKGACIFRAGELFFP